jgi:ABC-type lipopolysaccharide export system ATPase subunit
MSGDVLVIEGLTAARGGRIIVHEVSLEIPGGTVTTLLGPNGGASPVGGRAADGLLHSAYLLRGIADR